MDRRLRAVSIFSVDKASGHSVYDDQFYFELLKKHGRPFTFYAPPYSVSQLKKRCAAKDAEVSSIAVDEAGWRATVRAIRSIKVAANDKVIFLGYSERIVALFVALKILTKYEMILVATNNICHRRVAKYRLMLKAFFHLISFRLSKLVVHTEEEKRLCAQLNNELGRKTVVKKHYLMIPQEVPVALDKNSRVTVAYFGPDKYYKPLQPMIDLILADSESVFDYKFVNVDRKDVERRCGSLAMKNVKFINRRLSKREYFDEYSKSSFIMMTHDRSFEGKLSGNLCDCFSVRVPFIAAKVEPVPSLISEYGKIGCVYDFSDPEWCSEFIGEFSPRLLATLRENLSRAGAEYTRPIVEQDNIDAILR